MNREKRAQMQQVRIDEGQTNSPAAAIHFLNVYRLEKTMFLLTLTIDFSYE